jgi:hypothetical protein
MSSRRICVGALEKPADQVRDGAIKSAVEVLRLSGVIPHRKRIANREIAVDGVAASAQFACNAERSHTHEFRDFSPRHLRLMPLPRQPPLKQRVQRR